MGGEGENGGTVPESGSGVETGCAPEPLDAPEPLGTTESLDAPKPLDAPEALGAPEALDSEPTHPTDTEETTAPGEAPTPDEAPEPPEAASLPEAPEPTEARHPLETLEPQFAASDALEVPEPVELSKPLQIPESPEAPEPPDAPDAFTALEPMEATRPSESLAPSRGSDSFEVTEPLEVAEPPERPLETPAPPEAPDALEAPEPPELEEAIAGPADDIPLQGPLLDRMKSVFGSKGDQVREISEFVDKPEFQVPEKMYPPDRYGTPLDRPDGTRTPLFDGTPTREQTKQGALGDCGVIATLGAVAGHRPQDILNAVRENEDGTYEVRFHAAKSVGVGRYEPTGDVIKLTVTPDLPIYDELPGAPAFADSVSTGAAWAPIMEKALAGLDQTWTEERAALWKLTHNRPNDLRTGYVRMGDGTKSSERAELLVQLTGLPAQTWDVPTSYDHEGRSVKRQVIDHFTEKLADNCPIVVGTRNPKVGEAPLPENLIGGHAYEVTEVDDRGLIYFRNPYNKNNPEPLKFEDFRKYFLPLYTTLESK
jgi:hypothetical protein